MSDNNPPDNNPLPDNDDDRHLRRLIASWGMIADFCFGDLLLFRPDRSDDPRSFRIIGQVRPTTGRTLYQDDLVGRTLRVEERPLLGDCFGGSEIIRGQNFSVSGGRAARIDYVPITRLDPGATTVRTIAVLTRESAVDATRRPGRLERVYVEIFEHFTSMIAAGLFPFAANDTSGDDSLNDPPRVGDGVIIVDGRRTIIFASPNAVSALHRLGLKSNAEGKSISALSVGLGAADGVFATRKPLQVEVERIHPEHKARMIVALNSFPILERHDGNVVAVGAVTLLRDVTDIRRRDRLLVTKDATIREVHHRVKNNLQTISSLLRLQARRTDSAEAREAIEEAGRRIRAIALVHETLAHDVRDAVPFDDIVRPLIRLVEESSVSAERPIRIRVHGSLGDLAPEVATPLAVALTELVHNAIEHAFPGETTSGETTSAAADPSDRQVIVELHRGASELAIDVRDNGVGLSPRFSLNDSASLGLSIVRTLVTTELRGVIALRTEDGTVASIRIPLTLG